MRKLLLSLTAIAALLTVVSCSKSDVEYPVDPNEPVELKVGGKALDISATTRAPFEGIGSTKSGDLDARVLASTVSLEYKLPSLLRNGRMIFKDNSTAQGFVTEATSPASSPVYYPDNSQPVYLVGLYPFTEWAIDNSDGKSATRPFTGKEDIMATRQFTTTKTFPQTYATLNFHHLLTRFNIQVQAENQEAIDAWGNIEEIKVKSTNNVKVNFVVEDENNPGLVPTYVFSGNDNLSALENGGETSYTNKPLPLKTQANLKPQSYVMVGPINGNNSTVVAYELSIKTAKFNGTTPYTVTVPLKTADNPPLDFKGDTQGKFFNIVLTFTSTEIKAKATVEDWKEGGSGTGEIN